MLPGYAIGIKTGIRWDCKVCGCKQEPVEDEEWPTHCGEMMKMVPWYRLMAVQDEPAPSKGGGEEGRCP